MRAHGETTGPVPSTFRRAHAAEDVYEFMVRHPFPRQDLRNKLASYFRKL